MIVEEQVEVEGRKRGRDLTISQIKERFNEVTNCMLTCRLVKGKKRFNHQGRYYKELVPPNWDIAEKHQKAQKIAKQVQMKENEEYEVCPCCMIHVEKRKIEITEDPIVLSFLGSGYPLYFNFIRYSIIIIGVTFLCSGSQILWQNFSGNDCYSQSYQQRMSSRQQSQKHLNQHKELDQGTQFSHIQNICVDDIVTRLSIANHRFNMDDEAVSDLLNVVSTVALLVIIFIFRRSQLLIDNDCDIKENTPPDYTLMCSGFPQVDNPDYYIKKYFEQDFEVDQTLLNQKITVTNINVVSYMEDIDELQRKSHKLLDKKRKAIEGLDYGTDCFYRTIWDYDKKIFRKKRKIYKKAKEILDDKSKFTGVAFVSFETEDQKQYILRSASLTVKSLVCNCMMGCLVHENKSIQCGDSIVQVSQAPEPSDIIWHNLVHKPIKRLGKRLFGFILSKAVIGVFLWLLLEVSKYQAIYQDQINQYKKQQKVQEDHDQGHSVNHTFAFACSLFTVFINSFVVIKMSVFLVEAEAYETFSQYDVSLAQKLSLTLFFNSALVAYLTSTIYTSNFYGPGGLIYIETYFFISNGVLPPIIGLIDTNRMEKKFWVWWEKRKGNACQLTQQEANQLCEPPEHPIELRYADIMKTLYLTFFYANLIPIGFVISFFGLIAYYWSEKYVILTYQTVKHTPSIQLSLLMTEMLDYLPIMFTCGNLLFKYQITGYLPMYSLLGLLISLVNFSLPMQGIVETFFSPEQQDETTNYMVAAPNFQQTYESENPVTRPIIEQKLYTNHKNSYNLNQEVHIQNELIKSGEERQPSVNSKGSGKNEPPPSNLDSLNIRESVRIQIPYANPKLSQTNAQTTHNRVSSRSINISMTPK